MEKTLEEVVGENKGIRGAAIVSAEGLLLARYGLPELEDQDYLAGVLASAAQQSRSVVSGLGLGSGVARALAQGDRGLVAFASLDRYILAVVGDRSATLGTMFLAVSEMENALGEHLKGLED